jgi:hypothetical protein
MPYRVIALLFFALFSVGFASAQLMIEQGPSGSTRDGSLIVYGLTGSGSRLPYEKIKGSAFLFDDWKTATLYHSSGKSFGSYQVKLNLATHEVHYKNAKGEELADDGSISRIVFEESSVEGKRYVSYVNDIPEINVSYSGSRKYAVELYNGELSLLKVSTRTVSQADSLFGTLKRYYFTDKNDYFLRGNKRVERLKKLSEDEILQFLPRVSELQAWIKSNKLKLNKEEDAVKFIQYVNNQRRSAQ